MMGIPNFKLENIMLLSIDKGEVHLIYIFPNAKKPQ